MTLFLDAKTPLWDIFIDYIEVILASGEQISLNWDYSGIDRTEDGFSAKYSGVYFGEVNARGRIDELKKISIVEIGYYTEITDTPATIEIEGMYFVDNEFPCQSLIDYTNDYNLCFTG